MKEYVVPLTFAEHHIDILGPEIRRAFTGPLFLVQTVITGAWRSVRSLYFLSFMQDLLRLSGDTKIS